MKRHQIRARILDELYKQAHWFSKLPHEETRGLYFEVEASLELSDIAKRIEVIEKDVESQIQFLEHIGEVQYISEGPDVGWYIITPKGRLAYADDKYSTLWSEERFSYWSKRISIVATLGTLLISSLALYKSWLSSEHSSGEFNKVNQRIDSVNASVKKIYESKQNSLPE